MTEMAVPGTLKVRVGGVSVPVPFYSMPPGVMAMWPTANPPAGWLLCQGQSILVADQPSLHAVIGYTYGGSGANFNLPDLRVRVPLGAGTSRALASNEGLAEGSRAARRVHSHTHTEQNSATLSVTGTVPALGSYGVGAYSVSASGDHQHNYAAPWTDIAGNTQTGGGANRMTGGGTVQPAGNHSHSVATDIQHGHGAMTSTGGVHSHTIDSANALESPYLAVHYIIKV